MKRPHGKKNGAGQNMSAQKTSLSTKATRERKQNHSDGSRAVTVTFDSLFAAACSLEASGMVVPAIALLEAALQKSQLGISSMEHAHLLIFTARTYRYGALFQATGENFSCISCRLYTDNIKEPKTHASKAIQV
jgi:hypothetical protein